MATDQEVKAKNNTNMLFSMGNSLEPISNGGGIKGLKRENSIHSFLEPFPTQIAGHGSEDDGHRGFLKHRHEGWLLKPIQTVQKGQRESSFYKTINESKEDIDKEIFKWIPRYGGIETVDQINGDPDVSEDYLVLEDLTQGFELPNVMDIKIGSRTWGPGTPLAKQQQEDAKYAGTKGPLGFSVLGILVHPIRGDSDAMTKYDKNFGRHLKTEDVHTTPEIFFDVQNSGVIVELVDIVVSKMKAFREAYRKNHKYNVYASSLLFAYDAARVRQFLADGDRAELERWVDVKLIDFANVFPSEDGGRDENFLAGLDKLIEVFESVLSLKKPEEAEVGR